MARSRGPLERAEAQARLRRLAHPTSETDAETVKTQALHYHISIARDYATRGTITNTSG